MIRKPTHTAQGSHSRGEPPRPLEILLVVMPFAAVEEPALGVSTLKAGLTRAGFTAHIRYFNLDFAALIGLPLYHEIGRSLASRSLVADWIFARALFGARAPDPASYRAHLQADYARWEDGIPYGEDFGSQRNFTHYLTATLWPLIVEARRQAGPFIARCVRDIVALNPRVVGFTSSCQMACAALAAGRRLKARPNPPVLLYGGPNCHGDVGWHWLRHFPWIDYICTGEGDEVLPAFLRRLLRHGDPRATPGLLRQGASRRLTLPPLPRDLDRLPPPDYADYLRQWKASPLRAAIGRPVLPVESSRGCWWGERIQCVFCGNCRHTIPYRSKSAGRVVRELFQLSAGAPFDRVSCVDDALDRAHIRRVFPRLKARRFPLPLFYQTRPNLSRRELQTLVAGGVRTIQPGIESFSDAVLTLMRKGTRGLHNIRLLRWCAEVGMEANWNFLYGFAGEPAADYERMAALVPWLTHLEPPIGCVGIALKRFSPYWYAPAQHGLQAVRPWPSYRHIYPFPERVLAQIAFFFEFDYADKRRPFDYTRALRRAVGQWIMLWQQPVRRRPRLTVRAKGAALDIADTRPGAVRRRRRLRGLAARLYRFCETVRGRAAIAEAFNGQADDARVWPVLAALVADRLVVEWNGHYVGVAVRKKASPRSRTP